MFAISQTHTANAQFTHDDYAIFGVYNPGPGYNGRDFGYGDTVKLEGTFYATTNSSPQPLGDVLIDVTMHRPDGKTVSILKDYLPEKPGQFIAEIHINETFPVGKYFFDFSAHRKGHTSEPNENQSPFYVARIKQFTIPAEGKEFHVTTDTIEQEVSNVQFDKESKSLIIYANDVPGKYASDDYMQFPNTLGITIQRPLISPPFYVDMNNQTNPMQDYDVQITNETYSLGINTYGQTNGTVTLIGTYVVPEFPFAIPVLIASITSLIIFYRIKFR